MNDRPSSITPESERVRLRRQREIERRLQDMVAEDPDVMAVALTSYIVSILARAHPGVLDTHARRRIEENYPDATDALMVERAMDHHGLALNVGGAMTLARMGLDYSPLSNVKADMERDFVLPSAIRMGLGEAVEREFARAVAVGLSPFGAFATIVLYAMGQARESGVTEFKIIRSLVEAVQMVLNDARKSGAPLSDAELAKALAKQMRVTEATARQYIREARQRASGASPT